MNTLLKLTIKEIDVKVDHEYIHINISHDLFTDKVSINDLKSLTTRLLKALQAK